MPRNKEDKNKEDQRDTSKNSRDRSRYPVHHGGSFRDSINRFFGDGPWIEPFDFFRRNLPRTLARAGYFFPRVDISQTENEIKVVADIPGADPDNINIDVQDNWMTISGKMESEKEMEEEKPYRYERVYGEFKREFSLPAQVKEEEIRAVYKDGVLTVTLPKVEEEKRNKIKIERG